MIPEISNHSYQQRLKCPELISLLQRRLRGQLIEVFKYLNMTCYTIAQRPIRNLSKWQRRLCVEIVDYS